MFALPYCTCSIPPSLLSFNGRNCWYYIPDWRFLLACPEQSLALLDALESELWAATQNFLQDASFRKAVFREGVTDEDFFPLHLTPQQFVHIYTKMKDGVAMSYLRSQNEARRPPGSA